MAHDSVINAFIHVGLRQKDLQNILASNVVLDWFGRTLTGKQRVVDFYLNSSNLYEHNVTSTEATQPFEERSTHTITRKEPEENFERSINLSSNEQWYDCEAQPSIDMKEFQRTPPKKQAISIDCPPAPCRRFLDNSSSDEEVDSDSEGDMIELGVYPLDTSPPGTLLTKREKNERFVKRQRLEMKKEPDIEANITEQTTIERESKYSELFYLESKGSVTTFRQGSSSTSRHEDIDRRECRLLISYRLNKDTNDIQIALIVYKSNNTNQKSRRNLMIEFTDEISESNVSSTPSISRFNTVIKENPKILDNTSGINTAPAGNKPIIGTKRPMMSRNRLRF